MKRTIVFLIMGILVLASGCSYNAEAFKYQWQCLGGSEGDYSSQFQLETFSGDNTEYEYEEEIEFELFGKTYQGVFDKKIVGRYPYFNELFQYLVVDTGDKTNHNYLGFACINPKSGELVIYSSLYETEKERASILSEEELQDIANLYASQYITIDEFVCTIVKKDPDAEDSDYRFYYNRSINGVTISGGVIIVLTCDGRLLSLHNTLNAEWKHAIDVMGMEYYEERVTSLASEEALKELERIFNRPDISSWEITNKALVLIDETHAGLSYSIAYSIKTTEGNKQEATIRILATEKGLATEE